MGEFSENKQAAPRSFRQRRARRNCTEDANSIGVVLTKCVHGSMQMSEPLNKAPYTQKAEHSSGDLLALSETAELCSEFIEVLETASSSERHEMLSWLQEYSRQLALSKAGCRVVQKAFEMGGPSEQTMLITELAPHIVELYESPWGNHVLSRAIEVLPAAKNDVVIAALQGRALVVSKHRYGCRIICRLLEHCTDQQISSLLDEVVLEADILARHAYGNFVVQSMLEHASPARRAAVFWKVLSDLPALATHRTGSLVAQRVLDYCDAECKNHAIQALLQADENNGPVDIACSHYGSYVIEQVASLRHKHDGVLQIARVLACGLETLRTSMHADRVITAFELA